MTEWTEIAVRAERLRKPRGAEKLPAEARMVAKNSASHPSAMMHGPRKFKLHRLHPMLRPASRDQSACAVSVA